MRPSPGTQESPIPGWMAVLAVVAYIGSVVWRAAHGDWTFIVEIVFITAVVVVIGLAMQYHGGVRP